MRRRASFAVSKSRLVRILFFGTSHCGMFREAWGLLPEQARAGWTADFFAAPAPMLAKAVSESKLPIEGVWRHHYPELSSYLARLKGGLVDEVSFREYDRVVFVDMFCCYDNCHLHTSNGIYGLALDGVPVSRSAWNAAIRSTICRAEYNDHPRVGNLLPMSLLPFIEMAVRGITPANVFVTPRPVLPSQRLNSRYGKGLCGDMIGKCVEWFDAVATDIFAQIGVTYVPRPECSICPRTGGSLDELSVGWLDEGETKLNEHLTAEYASPIINSVIM